MKKNPICRGLFRQILQNRKILFRMKLTSLLTLLLVFQLSASVLSQNVTLKVKDANLKQVFKSLKKQTGVYFLYSDKELSTNIKINLDVNEKPLKEALEQIFNELPLDFEYDNEMVIVKPKLSLLKEQQKKGRFVGGNITDKDGVPLPGVNVAIDGTIIGVATDVDGKFQIEIPEDIKDAVLVFSFIGMKTRHLKVGNKTNLKVVLEVDIAEIEEIVVTGMFERKAETYTGSAKTVSSDELTRVGNTNVLDALKNIDPGFQMIDNNEFGSDPNRMPDIQMRGAGSFSDMKDRYQTNPNQPLFIVDGFEQNIETVMDMDMNKVESITLLKDAAAKALYGSRGANGVVVIETKAPAVGKLRVSYTADLSITSPDLSSYNLCNAIEKLEIERLAGIYTASSNHPGTQYELDQKYNFYKEEIARGVNTDWLAIPVEDALGHKHSLAIEGGDDILRYKVDFSYKDVKGVMKGSGRKTISGGLMLSYRVSNLIFREQLTVYFNKAKNSPYGNFSEYAKMNPYWRPYGANGDPIKILGSYNVANTQGEHPIYNPIINATINTNNENDYTRITNNFYVEWLIGKGFKATSRIGINTEKNGADIFYPRDHTMFANIPITSEDYFLRGEYNKTTGETFEVNADFALNYSKSIGKNQIYANAQYSLAERKYDDVSISARGFANNKMDYITHAIAYNDKNLPTGISNHSREMSFLTSVNYSWDSRLLTDITYRANASSLFGSDKRWGSFWSLGLGWNIHREAFISDLKWINKLKIRGSIGSSGTQNFSPYMSMATYKYYGGYIYDNIIGAYLMALPNKDLQWQKTNDSNIGFELSLFDRINIDFDYYISTTDNMLTPVALPPSAGFPSYTENLGKSENKGLEAKVQANILRNSESGVYLSLFGSIAHNKNRIKEISDALNYINSARDNQKNNNNYDHEKDKEGTTKPSVRYEVGQSLSAIWAVRSLGIDPGTGDEIFLTKDGKKTYEWRAEDQVVSGDLLPKVSGTFGFNFEYKAFSVNTSFYYRLGGQMYNQTLVDKVENSDIQYNVDNRNFTDRWTTPGQDAMFKRLTEPAYFTRPTSRFVQDYSELQLSSVNIGYDFRNFDFVRKGAFESLKLKLYMNDVFRLSTVETERGTEYPFARTFSFSISATF